jgi:hypothetical protein
VALVHALQDDLIEKLAAGNFDPNLSPCAFDPTVIDRCDDLAPLSLASLRAELEVEVNRTRECTKLIDVTYLSMLMLRSTWLEDAHEFYASNIDSYFPQIAHNASRAI